MLFPSRSVSLRVGAYAAGTLALLAVAGCTAAPVIDEPGQASPEPAGDGHGAIAGASEVAEPPLHLLSIDGDGAVSMLDLLDDATAELDPVGPPQAVATDGRYAFVTTPAGLEIVDSGMWTWDHVDHFHYYRAEPRTLGAVAGEGPAVIVTGPLSTAGATGVFFEGSGEAVLLDNEALSDGEIVELFRIDAGARRGLVAPLGGGALVADGEGGLRFHDADGAPTDARAECADPAGAITTRAALAVSCADGAVLATMDGGDPVFERIPYPEGAAPAVTEAAGTFDGRKGRPTVAARAGDRGFWLLDARERAWRLVETDVPLARVAAVDDEAGHVVGLDTQGRVRVFLAGTGEQVAQTEPLVESPAAIGTGIAVDGQRAYVNAAEDGVVYEIDYADGARVARTLETPTTPEFFAEVGR